MRTEEMALLARTLASEKSHIGRENELVCHSISDKTIFLKKKNNTILYSFKSMLI